MKVKVLFDQLKSLFYPVRKVPTSDFIDGVQFNSHMDHLIIVDSPKGPVAVNSCSKNYHIISNEELMTPLIERLGKEYTDIQAKVVQYNYAKFYTDFTLKDTRIEVMPKDYIYPRVRMNNSYDGSVRYMFNFGFWRQVCTNGLTAPVAGMQSGDLKLRHTGGVGGGAVDRTMRMIDKFMEAAPKIAAGYQELVDAKLTWDRAMKAIEEIMEETKYPKKKMEVAIARLKYEHEELKAPLNDFLLYNALNYALYQGEGAMKEHKKDKIDAQILRHITNS